MLEQLKTQTQAYWQDDFAVTNRDLEFLYSLLIETGLPLDIRQITRAIVEQRQDEEMNRVRANLKRGRPFQPQGAYHVGDGLVFPAFDGAYGEVVAERPGFNPEYGNFTVIEVRIEGENKSREFASQLSTQHKLNVDGGSIEQILSRMSDSSAEEVLSRHGRTIERRVEEGLRKATGLDFVNFADQWYLRGLLADVHVGHRNVVEAVLDISGTPMPPLDLMKQIDLAAEIRPEARLFSLNYALTIDERFDNVGTDEQVLWFLRRMEPPEAVFPPRRLLARTEPYDRSVLTEELLRFERELDDELSALDVASGEILESPSVSFVLIYPHRRVGSLPLTNRIRQMFPTGSTQHTRVTLIDGQTGDRITAWISHEHRYIFGLDEWFRRNGVQVGAYITLEKTKEPFAAMISFLPKRERREWIRVARAEAGQLRFEMKKQPVRCEYDELMVVGEDSPAEVDSLWIQTEEDQVPLSDLIRGLVPELSKLSPQGTVHAKTIYSAINIVRRCPPGPVFAQLASDPSYRAVGGGFWNYEGIR